jgi:antitoxin component YwqK of YwqJK toxin-antitoxin module
MVKYLIFILIILSINNTFAQDTVVKNGYQIFHYPNGKVASEGTMKDGKPDGYWKTYDKYGLLKSEGNRKNFLLDSIWKFYDTNGKIKLSISYKNDLKSGLRITYLNDKILIDSFENDLKNNWCIVLFSDSSLMSKTFYINGLEEGWAYKYDRDGRLISKVLYSKGFIRKREFFNGLDAKGKKNGIWKGFYENGGIKWSGNYRHGSKNGYFKYYGIDGNLDSIHKYRKVL